MMSEALKSWVVIISINYYTFLYFAGFPKIKFKIMTAGVGDVFHARTSTGTNTVATP